MIFEFNPHPDELLYSVLARFNLVSRNVMIGSKETVQDAFSSRTASAVYDLPTRLSILHSNLPVGTHFTPERMIQNLTLYRLYAPFLPPDRAEKVIEKMKMDGDVHTTIGVLASRIPFLSHMRYCHECIVEDCNQFGEPYWHISHQIPGIHICHKHYSRLLTSSLQVSSRENKHEFIDISQAITSGEEVSQDNPSEHERFLANAAYWLLRNEPPIIGLEVIREKYIACLQQEGYASFSGKVHNEKFMRSFVGFYGRDFLRSLDCEVIYKEQNWLLKMVRKQRGAAHPIQHLLMMHFLGLSPDIFFTTEIKYLPFGEGPWPCLNRGASHVGHATIREVKITRDYDTGLPMGTFSCPCGFVYSRRGPDRTVEDRSRIGEVKVFGKTWEKQLLKLSSEGKTITSIASVLGCDRGTVIKYKRILAGGVQEEAICAREVPEDRERNKRRKRWLQLQQIHPLATRKELREMAPKDFAWLYRHDNQWLYQQLPDITVPQKYSDTRVNWEARDQQMLIAATTVVEKELSTEEKPERITVSMIGKRIAELGVLQKHPEKVPLTIAFIHQAVETLEEFQIRRVKYVAEELRRDKELVLQWKIVRKAGLRPGFSEAVTQQIHLECKNI